MPNNIPNVTVPAPVIQLNNHQYLTDEHQYDPQTMNVPCGINALVDPYQWWMVPVKNEGIISILQTVSAIGENTAQPTDDSISVIRIRDKYEPYWTWWVICTLAEYYASCAACCGDSPVAIPTPTLPMIIPCQTVCNSTDGSGNYISVIGIPDLHGGSEFVGFANIDGEQLADVSGTTAALLLTDINSKWGTISSPSRTIVWTKSSDNLTLIGTGWDEDDVVCVLIIVVPSSP